MSAIVVPVRALAVGLLLGLARAAGAQEPEPVDAAIVLAVDASGSVDYEERAIQREGYAAALRHPELMRAVTGGPYGRIAISYFEWAGQPRATTLIPWRMIDGPEAAEVLAGEIVALSNPAARGTSIARALDFATDLFLEDRFTDTKRIIDISADGPNNIGPPVTGARDRAIANGITVNGLPILVRPSRGMRELDVYFADCVIGGEGAFLLAVREREALAFAIRRKLILEISGTQLPPVLVPAQGSMPTDCLVGERLRGRWQGNY